MDEVTRRRVGNIRHALNRRIPLSGRDAAFLLSTIERQDAEIAVLEQAAWSTRTVRPGSGSPDDATVEMWQE